MCNKKACYAFNDNHAPENWDLWSLTEGDMQQNGYWRQLKLPKRRAWCCSIHCFIKTKHQMKARSQVDDRRAYIRCCKLRHSHLHIMQRLSLAIIRQHTSCIANHLIVLWPIQMKLFMFSNFIAQFERYCSFNVEI